MDGGWGGTPPIVFGHEAAGVVAEVGGESDDAAIRPGARVVVTLLRSCGRCAMCNAGFASQCEGAFDESPHLHDASGAPVFAGLKTGAFAEEVVVHLSQIAPIPDSLPFAEASLLACGVLTGWGAVVNTARVPPGASAAVVGCGGVGLNCLQAARAAGAHPVAAADISETKLALAATFGATATINVKNDSPEKAKNITGGRGFDYVFMAAGNARAVEYAAQLVAKNRRARSRGNAAERRHRANQHDNNRKQSATRFGQQNGRCAPAHRHSQTSANARKRQTAARRINRRTVFSGRHQRRNCGCAQRRRVAQCHRF